MRRIYNREVREPEPRAAYTTHRAPISERADERYESICFDALEHVT